LNKNGISINRRKNRKIKIKIPSSNAKKQIDFVWLLKVSILTFTLSVIFELFVSSTVEEVDTFLAAVIIIFIVLFGIIFDIIGVAATTAEKQPFHSMAAHRVPGAKEAIKLINKKDKVSSFCNDVVGDTCGIISGGASSVLAMHIVMHGAIATEVQIFVDVVVTGVVAALTVGGRSIGKSVAISNCNTIVFAVARFLNFFKFGKFGRTRKRKKSGKSNLDAALISE
jgi:hypothetical protein